jgi:hypothetical protein
MARCTSTHGKARARHTPRTDHAGSPPPPTEQQLSHALLRQSFPWSSTLRSSPPECRTWALTPQSSFLRAAHYTAQRHRATPGQPLELASDAPLASIQQQQAVLVSRLIMLRDKLRRLRVTGVYLLFDLVTGEFSTYTAEHEEQYAAALRDCRCNPELPAWYWFEKSLQYYFANAEWQLHVLQMRHYENEARIEDMLQQQQLDDSSDGDAAQHAEAAAAIDVSGEVEVAGTGLGADLNTST